MRCSGPQQSVISRTHGSILAIVAAVIVTTAIAAPPAAARGGKERLDRVERTVMRMINTRRARVGAPRLRASPALARAADFHSWDMLRSNVFAHASANGTSAARRVSRYRRARRTGETIGYVGHGTRGYARRIVSMWMASPGHRAVLMSRSFRRLGIARRSGVLGGIRATVFTADLQSKR